jgi:hypothetical protein
MALSVDEDVTRCSGDRSWWSADRRPRAISVYAVFDADAGSAGTGDRREDPRLPTTKTSDR